MNALRLRSLTTPRRLAVGLFVFIAACHQAPPPVTPAPQAPRTTVPAARVVNSGIAVLQAMHDKYPSWYRTITFSQRTTLATRSGGEIVQTWHEAGALPGRLRIDTDLNSKSGTLFAHDSIFSFNAGKLVRADTGSNELLVLGFDVYAQPAERTAAQLRGLGFDISRFHEGAWRGVPVYVVGALAGDTSSKQFWVERDRLLFVRLLGRTAQGLTETRFDNYEQVDGGWVAADVVQLENGKRRLHEEYSNVRVNVPLSEALFDARQWNAVPTWVKPAPSKR